LGTTLLLCEDVGVVDGIAFPVHDAAFDLAPPALEHELDGLAVGVGDRSGHRIPRSRRRDVVTSAAETGQEERAVVLARGFRLARPARTVPLRT
jgi:hypothetical protein